MTPEDILAEEQALVLDRFDLETAWRLGSALRAIAEAERLPVAIEVARGAVPVFLTVLPGATADNPDWTRRKRATALRFERSSLYMRLACERDGKNFNARYILSDTEFVASGGAVPILVRGVGVVGTAAASGLPDVEDHRLILRGLRQIISQG